MFILDRFEETYAIIESTNEYGEISILKVSKKDVSPDTNEGDVLRLDNKIYVADMHATEERKRKIRDMLKNI